MSLRTLFDPLLRPARFFDRSELARSAAVGAVVVLVVSLLTTGVFGALVVTMTDRIDATETVDNPDRPPGPTCEMHGDDSFVADRCEEEPETIEIDVGDAVRDELLGYTPWVFVVTAAFWPLAGIALHVGAAGLAAGTGRFGETLAVTAWGVPPYLFSIAVGAIEVVSVLPESFSDDPDAMIVEFEAAAAAAGESHLSTVTLVVAAAWQAWIWTRGLEDVHELSKLTAAGVAALVALVGLTIAVV